MPRSVIAARLARARSRTGEIARNPLAAAGLAVIVLLVAVAALAPYLAPYDPQAQELAGRLAPPGPVHWLGTDELGRDIASRLIWGARVTLVIVALVAAISAPLGLVLGCVAGYLGGWADVALMRLTDVFLAFPRLILALALAAALGPGIDNAVLAIALTSWPVYARVARAEALVARSAEFVDAARLQGSGAWHIIRRQIIPLCVSSLVVRASLDMAGIILTAAGLGFLGLGARPPAPEWGAMIAAGREYLFDQWWVVAAPGCAILVVSLGFNLLGDGLRDVLDPHA
ncbi:MAG TPA: ABC transporter permease [Alphaproteobacteria bacterium]